jgi:hypothetical protein
MAREQSAHTFEVRTPVGLAQTWRLINLAKKMANGKK